MNKKEDLIMWIIISAGTLYLLVEVIIAALRTTQLFIIGAVLGLVFLWCLFEIYKIIKK